MVCVAVTFMEKRHLFPKMLVKMGLVKTGAEIGVMNAGHARLLLSKWPGHLYLVDPEKGKLATRRLHPYRDRITFHQTTSVAAAGLVADGGLDWAYIDADHRYEHVKEDIKAWLPKVREGGVIAGHDYTGRDCAGVIRAVDEAFGDRVKVLDTGDVHTWYALL